MIEGKEENEAAKQQKIADRVRQRIAKAKEGGKTFGRVDVGDLFAEADYDSVEACLLAESRDLSGTALIASEATDALGAAVQEAERRTFAEGVSHDQPVGGSTASGPGRDVDFVQASQDLQRQLKEVHQLRRTGGRGSSVRVPGTFVAPERLAHRWFKILGGDEERWLRAREVAFSALTKGGRPAAVQALVDGGYAASAKTAVPLLTALSNLQNQPTKAIASVPIVIDDSWSHEEILARVVGEACGGHGLAGEQRRPVEVYCEYINRKLAGEAVALPEIPRGVVVGEPGVGKVSMLGT